MLVFALLAVVQVASFRVAKSRDEMESLEDSSRDEFEMATKGKDNEEEAEGSETDSDLEDAEIQLSDAHEMESLVDDTTSEDLMAGRRRSRRREDGRSRGGSTPPRRRRGNAENPLNDGPRRRQVPSDFRRRYTKSYYSDFTSDRGWDVLDDCGHSHNNNGNSAVKYTERAVQWARRAGDGAVIKVQKEKSSKPDKDCRRRRNSDGATTYQISANLRWKQPSFYGKTTLVAKFFPEGGFNSSVCYFDSMGWEGQHTNSPSCWMNMHGCKDSDKTCQTTIDSACYNCKECGTSNNKVRGIKFDGNLRDKNKFQLVFHRDDVRLVINDKEVLRRTPQTTGRFNLPHEPMSPRVHCRSQHVENIKETTTVTLYEWKWEPQSSYDLQMLNVSGSSDVA